MGFTVSETRAADLWDAGFNTRQIARKMGISQGYATALVERISTGDGGIAQAASISASTAQLGDAIARYFSRREA
jgi:orotate phosphoribosyltransferase-like protein